MTDSAGAGEDTAKTEGKYVHKCAIQNLDLEDYVVENMTKIISKYRGIYYSECSRALRLNSKVHWLRSVKGIIGLILSQISSNATIADVGCGIGHFSALLSMLGQDVVGIDINSNRDLWKYLSKKSKCQFIRADARYLPLKERRFSVVLSYAVLEHLGSEKDEHRFLDEVFRIMTRDGKFVIGGVPNRFALTEILGPRFGAHEKKLTKEAVIAKLKSAMLHPIYTENEYFLPQYLPTDWLNDIWNRMAFQVVTVDMYLRHAPLHHSDFMIARKETSSKSQHSIRRSD